MAVMAGRDTFRTSDSEFADALALIRGGQSADAIPILTRMVSFDPDDHEAFELLINAHMDVKQYERALQLATEGIAAGRPEAPLLVWKSLACADLGRVDEAELTARQALEADPSLETAAFTLANLLVRQERPADALAVCREFLARNPDELIAREAVTLASDLDEFDLVIELAHGFLQRHGRDAEVFHRLGLAYIDTHDFRKGERAFRDAVALEPDDVEYNACVVLALVLQGNERKADRYVERLSARDPDLADAVDEFVDEISAGPEEDA